MKPNKRVIGLTGTIASGKSTAARYFARQYGIAVADADRVGHAVLQEPAVVEALVKEFGPGICGWPRQISRQKLGQLVFGDADKLARLNAITHPVICRRIAEWAAVEQARPDGRPFIIIEAIELLRSELKELADEVWVVYADPAIRQQRLTDSRGLSAEAARQRLSSQWDDAMYRACATRVLDGSGSPEQLERQCDAIYRELLSGAKPQ